jgi:hypothetical protein
VLAVSDVMGNATAHCDAVCTHKPLYVTCCNSDSATVSCNKVMHGVAVACNHADVECEKRFWIQLRVLATVASQWGGMTASPIASR